jgi:folate-binding protein YgfZ
MPSVGSQNGVTVSRGSAPWPAQLGSVRDEFSALRSTCGVFHRTDQVKLRLTGTDRVRWLNGMITNNIRDLAPQHGVYGFLLNPQGHILGDLTAYNRSDSIVVSTEASQLEKILATFDHYIIMDDVEVANIADQIASVGVAGPKSEAVLNATGVGIPSLQPLQMAEISWQGSLVTLIRGEHDKYPSFELSVAPDRVPALLSALQAAGAVPVGADALELYRIALGVPRYGQDIRERDLPQETEQERALNFNKGCYIGQEIVERIRSRGNVHRKFTGFKLNGTPPAPGAKIQSQGKEVGEITSATVIPAPGEDQAVALGYIRREFAVPGKEIQLEAATATVADLPFTDLLTP